MHLPVSKNVTLSVTSSARYKLVAVILETDYFVCDNKDERIHVP